MRAVLYDAFGMPPYVGDRDVPVARPHGVVIKVAATGLCRSDWHGWQGHDSDIAVLPHVPGHEFAGTVAAVGDEVRTLHVGQRVTVPFVCGCGRCRDCVSGNGQVCKFQWQPGFHGPGSFAEYVAIPNADFNVVHLPDSVSFEVAASLGCRFATAYRAVTQVAGVQPGERVAVFGCGGVGLAAIMIAKSRGASVVAVDISHEALDRARLAGADARIDGRFDDVLREVRAFGDDGVQVSIDAIGSADTVRLGVESLRRLGRHVQVGLLPPAVVGDRATVPMHLVIAWELTVRGSHGMAAAAYPELLADLAAERFRPETLLERIITLDETPAALATMADHPHPGVTIIRP